MSLKNCVVCAPTSSSRPVGTARCLSVLHAVLNGQDQWIVRIDSASVHRISLVIAPEKSDLAGLEQAGLGEE